MVVTYLLSAGGLMGEAITGELPPAASPNPLFPGEPADAVYFSLTPSPLRATSSVAAGEQPGREAVGRVIAIYGQAEVVISYPGYEEMSRLASRFSVSSCDGHTAHLCLSPADTALFFAEAVSYKLLVPEERKGFYTSSSVEEAMRWQSYPTWQQYDSVMHLIAERWPAVCRLDTIGFSVMGRSVLVLEITGSGGSGHKPEVMLSSSIHGDETAGFVLLMRLASYLAEHAGDDGTPVADLVQRLRIWINPLANPDGMYRDGDTIIYPVRANSNGYDLNRNFPDPTHSVPPPLQQETVDMIRFMAERRPVLSANLHSGSEVVNYPWDRWVRRHPDDRWFEGVSRRYADTVHRYAAPYYMRSLDNGITRGSEWYRISGGRQDYVTGTLGGREVTIELDGEKMTPGTALGLMWEWNYRSLLGYLAEALTGVQGTVTGNDTGDPLTAQVLITGHDADSSHVWSDSATGSYVRLLPPGTWRLAFLAHGYETRVIEAVLTEEEPLMIANVTLQRSGGSYPTPPASGVTAWPNPTTGEVSLMLPLIMSGEITVRAADMRGVIVREVSTTSHPGVPVPFSLSGAPPGIYMVIVRKEPHGPVVRGRVAVIRSKP